MSGHSKWAQIKHKKAKTDLERGKTFSKLIRLITVAARQGGGNPENNPRLRLAIQKAREMNMPQENIEKAIKKGTGELEGVAYEEIVYEGYGPGGVAIMVEATTDNRNRTTAEIRHLFSKHGGNLGETGCVSWVFERKGLISFERGKVDEEEVMAVAIDAGAEDIRSTETTIDVITAPEDFEKVKEAIDRSGLQYAVAQVTMVPKTTVSVEGKQAQQVLSLIEALEDHDDVQEVYANFDIADELLESLKSS
ncbi:YebC/PmpR family DNA-binding transcriptional regulator [Candidatus Caldatribacterium sp.]|uniref:YebC/PmpR family DNA-binding transcriptional regulator n=1 Tax=Candidatus Caldatribacterium sp. TaxID=2282143 RepID=UPI0029943EDB|nr:YebC/PmpR family DNA-binding transcriptional regulator [Candidatus Caldatribacterium sp.]MDW8081555.1 YebC/PmpR family DNA-binding transcriptional regulator [Candidatus Calescibacterium sp.]